MSHEKIVENQVRYILKRYIKDLYILYNNRFNLTNKIKYVMGDKYYKITLSPSGILIILQTIYGKEIIINIGDLIDEL